MVDKHQLLFLLLGLRVENGTGGYRSPVIYMLGIIYCMVFMTKFEYQ